MMNGYNFTTQVREVLARAREEAAALRHEYVGTEHVLLALLRQEGSVARCVIDNLGVDADAVRNEVLGVVKHGTASRTGPDLPYTSRAKKVLELAMSQARELNTNYVGTEHLLLGLIAEERGIAAQVLASHGLTHEPVLEETQRVLATSAAGDEAPPDVIRAVRRRPAAAGANERLRLVMNLAFEFAKARGSRVVGTPDCAIALLEHGEGSANAVFGRLGLDSAGVRDAIAAARGEASDTISPEDVLQLDPSLAAAMERERAAARAPHLSTAHLALALLTDDSSVAPIFAAAGMTRAGFSQELARISG